MLDTQNGKKVNESSELCTWLVAPGRWAECPDSLVKPFLQSVYAQEDWPAYAASRIFWFDVLKWIFLPWADV